MPVALAVEAWISVIDCCTRGASLVCLGFFRSLLVADIVMVSSLVVLVLWKVGGCGRWSFCHILSHLMFSYIILSSDLRFVFLS